MKKKNIISQLQNNQIKKTQAFSNINSKNWKTPKWSGKKWIKDYKPSNYKKKKKRQRILKWSRYIFNLKKRNFRIHKFIVRWRRFKRRHRRMNLSVLKKISIKRRFWNKWFKFYYYWLRRRFAWFGDGENDDLYKELNLTPNYINVNSWKKNFSLILKKVIYQKSLYRFRIGFKNKFIKKNTIKKKSFFFKSLEMTLIKFSLIDNRNWFSFFTTNQTLFNSSELYHFAKSKNIKIFFDMFIQNKLFNQIKQINILYSRHHFQYIHNQKIFEDIDLNKQKFPWWETLMFTQQTYKNRLSWRGQQFWFHKPFLLFVFKFYYRYKKPWEEKKKSLYSNFSRLVFNMENKNILEKPKRVKQLLNKIVLPFYGHIKPKQLSSIYKKSHFVKAKGITSSNLLLDHLENRLDVLIYRLNIAPNITWARRLIKAGLVFLQQNTSKKNMNDCFQKKKLYPIKLNKCFDLYSYSANDGRIKKFFFKSQPILRVNFTTKPGDIIQCHPFSLYQKWNIRPDLLNKPVPDYLLTKTKIDLGTEWNHWYRYLINNKQYLLSYNSRKRSWRKINRNFKSYRFEWNDNISKETTNFFLFKPQKKDFYSNDRNSPLFLNWTIQ